MRRIFIVVCLQVLSAISAAAFTAPAMVKDINPGPGDSSPVNFFQLGNKLVFFSNDGTAGTEPWVSDGTGPGTFMLRDVWPGVNNGFNQGCPTCNAVSNGTVVYFAASDGTSGSQLWRTDGTSIGTTKVFDGSIAFGLGIVGSNVFFTGNGNALYASDGTPGGTAQVPNGTGGHLSTGYELLDVGGIAYYSGSDAVFANELWRSDGTEAGTFRVKDINPGSQNSNPTNLTNMGGTLYFTATNGTGPALYKTDGTDAGTVLISQGGILGSPANERKQLPNVNGIIYFVRNEAASGNELWRSDGTTIGTYMVKDIYPGIGNGLITFSSAIAAIGNTIFFSAASDNPNAYELWKSDGTEPGTVMVKNINPEVFVSSSPKELANINGTLFFRAKGSAPAGDQPWMSDGTEPGTQQWALIRPAGGFSEARTFTQAGGNVFFAANNGVNGLELWAAESPIAGVPPGDIAGNLSLSQSQPNPMRSMSEITYSLSTQEYVKLKLYDTQGREVRVLVDQMQGSGLHRVDVDGRELANGVYYYRLSTSGGVRERKLVILK